MQYSVLSAGRFSAIPQDMRESQPCIVSFLQACGCRSNNSSNSQNRRFMRIHFTVIYDRKPAWPAVRFPAALQVSFLFIRKYQTFHRPEIGRRRRAPLLKNPMVLPQAMRRKAGHISGEGRSGLSGV
ncbi:MAG: hypothetical protein PT958_00195 [Firmicutes bacterium]|nr:hypothetical protein [Bacillota bacterium]